MLIYKFLVKFFVNIYLKMDGFQNSQTGLIKSNMDTKIYIKKKKNAEMPKFIN
jgi:hypothetical protein